jgi:hypothetical protein
MNSKANTGASARRLSWKIPRTWTWEWFTVVNAGNGQIALHSKVHNRFVRMNNRGGVDGSSASFANTLSRKWTWERFTVVKAGNGQIALHNKAHNRFIRMNNKANVDSSPKRSRKYLPKSWTRERFTIVQRGRCKRKRKIPRRKKIPRRRKIRRCPRGCRANEEPKVGLRQYLNVGKGDFTLRLSFKLKKRSFTSAALVFSGGNRVGLDPLFTGKSRGTSFSRGGTWRATRQYGMGPAPMKWHCFVIRRKLGRVSGFLNGVYKFTRPFKDSVTHVDIAPVRNTLWTKDFYFHRGWEPSLKCKNDCGVKVGGTSLLQTIARAYSGHTSSALAGLHAKSPGPPDLRWTADVVSLLPDGRESHRVVNLLGSSEEGFMISAKLQYAEAAVVPVPGANASDTLDALAPGQAQKLRGIDQGDSLEDHQMFVGQKGLKIGFLTPPPDALAVQPPGAKDDSMRPHRSADDNFVPTPHELNASAASNAIQLGLRLRANRLLT